MSANLNEIMEQVQVFASTYSLVGGRFDDGTKFGQSEVEKAILREMITEAVIGRILANDAPLTEDDHENVQQFDLAVEAGDRDLAYIQHGLREEDLP